MKRAENTLKHEDEILSRPRKTWHQSTGRQIAAKFGKMNFEKMLAGSQKRRPKQTQSNKIVNATYMKPSKPPQITTDKDSLSCDDSDTLKRRMPSARPPPVDASQAEEDNYDEEESEHVHTLSSRLGQASPVRQSRKLGPKQEEDALTYISPERKYTPVSADETITPSRSNENTFNRSSPTKDMSPISLSHSARQNERPRRNAGITRDRNLDLV